MLVTILKKAVIFTKSYHLQNRHLPFCNPINVGYEACCPAHAYGPIARNHLLLHYIERGKGSFFSGENTYELSAGMCFVIRPGEVTYYKADADDPWEYIWMGFTIDAPMPDCFREDVLHAKPLEDLFLSIKNNLEYYNGNAGENGRREAFLCGIAAEIVARFSLLYTRSVQTKMQSEMRIAKNYIDTKYASSITVGELAEQFHLERTYCSRCFKQGIGISPQEYLVNKRLSAAATLMADHGFTPTDAANAVGYEDICLFSKMFKRRYGVSPRKYKRSC